MATTTEKTKRIAGAPRSRGPLQPSVPYTMRLPDGRTVFVEVPRRMATTDRGGEVAFTPEGVRLLDRIRALASSLDSAPSPAFLASLRQAAGLTQEELGRRIGRDKLTISRWERGTMRPSRESLAALAGFFRGLKRSGVVLPG
jgi:DNA-binding XRE family transcriptional regulator